MCSAKLYRGVRKSGGKFLFCAALNICVFSGTAAAQDFVQHFDLPNARANAMGGYHAGLVDDFASAFFNPAGLALMRETFSAAQISVEMSNFELMLDLFAGKLTGEYFLSLIKDSLDGYLAIAGPISIGKIKNGFGWHVFNASRMNILWDREDIFRYFPRISEEFVLNAGYGYRLIDSGDSGLSVGISVRGFYRFLYAPDNLYVHEVQHLFAEWREKPYRNELGIGFDLGLLWTRDDNFSFGIYYKDIFSYATVSHYSNFDGWLNQQMQKSESMPVSPRVGLGITYRMKSPIMHRWDSDLLFSFDYTGIADAVRKTGTNQLYFITAGAELRFLEVISVRVGCANMMPSGGLGINLTGAQLDIGISARQLTNTPWERTSLTANLSMTFFYY